MEAYKFSDYEGIELVDTTGAGDCFTAAFAVGQLEGYGVERSLDFACKSAFLAVSKYGAGPAMPTREEVENFFSPKDNLPEHDDLEGKSFYALVRHAERICMVEEFGNNPKWEIKQDPILSDLG